MPRPLPGPALAVLALVAAGCSDRTGRDGAGAATPDVVPLFVDATAASGLSFTSLPRTDFVGYGQGVSVADVDGDGDLDVFLPQDRGPCALFRSDGGLRFTEIGAAAGVQVSAGEAHAKSAVFLDYDRDGRPDLFVGTAGEGSRLFRNLGDGTFGDVTAAAGVAGGAAFTMSAVPGDFDGDGWLDVYEVHCVPTDWAAPWGASGPPEPNRLWRNLGDGTFVDVAPALGVDGPVVGWAAQWIDLDADGDLDLLLANDHYFDPGRDDHDRAFINLGAAAGFAFEDRAADFGLDVSHSGMGFAAGDLDGDGLLDLYVSDIGPNELRLGGDPRPWPDRAPALGVAGDTETAPAHAITWGCAVLDFDRDGWQDLLAFRGSLAASDPGPPFSDVQVPRLWLSRPAPRDTPGEAQAGGRVFVESSGEAGLAGLDCRGARAAVPCDLDGDGDLDLVVSTRFGEAKVVRNDTPPRGPWYGVRLRGAASPLEGFGAVLELTAGGRTVRQWCSAGGQPGASLPPEWILAPGAGVSGAATLTVRWPSGTVQEVAPVRDGWTVVEEAL